MAIRRISDLPELLTHYQDADIDKCLLEVSYNRDANRYQSFYVKVGNLIQHIDESIGGWVTLTTNQEITGIKTFANGFIVTSSVYGTNVEVKGIGTDMQSITNQLSNHVPTCKAVFDYIKAQRFLVAPEGYDYKALIDMLLSMLSDEPLILYVDHVHGNDSFSGSIDEPIKTINEAVRRANKRRFVGTAQCYIRLINDYDVTGTIDSADYDSFDKHTSRRIDLYQPDLVQSKQMLIEGWHNPRATDEHSYDGNHIQRTIRFSYVNATIPYEALFYCYCNTSFAYINFEGDAPADAAQATANGDYSKFGLDFYTIATQTGGGCYFEKCRFLNLSYGIEGSGIGVNTAAFSNCLAAIAGSGSNSIRTTFRGSIGVWNCANFIAALNCAIVDIDWYYETKVDLQVYGSPISMSTAANITFYMYNDNVAGGYSPTLRAFVVKKLDANNNSVWYAPNIDQVGGYEDIPDQGRVYYISWMQFIRLLVYGNPNYPGERSDVGYSKDGYFMLALKPGNEDDAKRWLTAWMKQGLIWRPGIDFAGM